MLEKEYDRLKKRVFLNMCALMFYFYFIEFPDILPHSLTYHVGWLYLVNPIIGRLVVVRSPGSPTASQSKQDTEPQIAPD